MTALTSLYEISDWSTKELGLGFVLLPLLVVSGHKLTREHIGDGVHPGSAWLRCFRALVGAGSSARLCPTRDGSGRDCSSQHKF